MSYYRDLENDISRGLIPGSYPMGSYGKMTTAGPVTNQIIWPDGTYAVPPQTGFIPEILSSDAQDTNTTGTGIWTIEIHYIDGSYNEATGYATLNGLTPVSIYDVDGVQITDMRFVQCMHMLTYGTSKSAVGNITLREVGQTQAYSYLEIGAKRCSSSARMVPAGKQLLILQAFGSSTSTTADETTNITIVSTYFSGHDYTSDGIFIPYNNLGFRNNSFGAELKPPLILPEKTVVAMMVTTDKAAILSGSWSGFVENTTNKAT